MPGITEALAELHQQLLDLQHVNEELERGPRQIKVREQKIAAARDEGERLKEDLRQTRAAADRKSLDLRAREAKIADLRAKLNACTSNKEYDILRGQIEADEVANSVLEDEILELLEKVDQTQREIAEADSRAKQLQAECSTFAEKVSQESVGLQARASGLSEQIRTAEPVLAGDNLTRYRRLVDAHGAEGLAAVDRNGVCQQCFVTLTPQAQVQLRSGQILFCSNCGRLLYAAQ